MNFLFWKLYLFILGMKVNLQEIYFAAQGRHLEIVSIVSIVLR